MTKPKSKPPRQDKLTPELVKKLVKSIRGGSYLETAAASVGLSRETLRSWLRRGARERSGPYAELLRDLRAAEADAETKIVTRIAAAGATDWRADAWRAERRFPDRYGNRARLDVAVSLEVKRQAATTLLEAVRGRMSRGAFRELLDALAEADADQVDDSTPLSLPATSGALPS